MPKQKDVTVTVKQALTAKDYAEASAAVKYFAVPMRRRSVRAAICFTAAALAASFLPVCGSNVSARNAVAAAAVLCAAACAVVWFAQPGSEKRRAEQWFRLCPLAALPAEVTVSHECAVSVSECERMTEYWTDFSICVETDELIAAAGGRERFLFVVKKNGLPEKEAKKLSDLMRGAFDNRWYRMPRKGGR